MNTKELKELGLEKAAQRIDERREFKRKLAIAYEHYRVVTPGIFERFETALHDKTKKIEEVCRKCKNKNTLTSKVKNCSWCQGTGAERYTYDKLSLSPLKEYPELPPPDCLLDLKKARDLNCFDTFEVGKVETVEVRPDPIIFGVINNCDDRFFITQWDDDVKIEDILKEGEG